MSDEKTGTAQQVTFSEALIGLKEGRFYQRKNWNGKGLFIQLHTSMSIDLLAKNDEDKPAYYNRYALEPFFVIIDNKRVNTWVPSISDILAVDWIEFKPE